MSTSLRPDRVFLAFGVTGSVIGTLFGLLAFVLAPSVAVTPIAPLPPLKETDAASLPPLTATAGEADRRPLFVPSRHADASPGADRGTDLAPDLLVTGIIFGVGGNVALGIDKRTTTPFALKTGDRLDDWQVQIVAWDHLRLQRQGQDRDYPLNLSSSGKDAQRP